MPDSRIGRLAGEHALEPEHEREARAPFVRRLVPAGGHLRERLVERAAARGAGREHLGRIFVRPEEGLTRPTAPRVRHRQAGQAPLWLSCAVLRSRAWVQHVVVPRFEKIARKNQRAHQGEYRNGAKAYLVAMVTGAGAADRGADRRASWLGGPAPAQRGERRPGDVRSRDRSADRRGRAVASRVEHEPSTAAVASLRREALEPSTTVRSARCAPRRAPCCSSATTSPLAAHRHGHGDTREDEGRCTRSRAAPHSSGSRRSSRSAAAAGSTRQARIPHSSAETPLSTLAFTVAGDADDLAATTWTRGRQPGHLARDGEGRQDRLPPRAGLADGEHTVGVSRAGGAFSDSPKLDVHGGHAAARDPDHEGLAGGPPRRRLHAAGRRGAGCPGTRERKARACRRARPLHRRLCKGAGANGRRPRIRPGRKRRPTAGSRSVTAPRLPRNPVRAVHVSADAWAHDGLRGEVLKLLDEKRINTVELDLKDELGIVGWRSGVPLARRIGAERQHVRPRRGREAAPCARREGDRPARRVPRPRARRVGVDARPARPRDPDARRRRVLRRLRRVHELRRIPLSARTTSISPSPRRSSASTTSSTTTSAGRTGRSTRWSCPASTRIPKRAVTELPRAGPAAARPARHVPRRVRLRHRRHAAGGDRPGRPRHRPRGGLRGADALPLPLGAAGVRRRQP